MATETHFSNESKMVADVTASVINDFKGAEADHPFKVAALGSLQPLSSSPAVSSLDGFWDAFPPCFTILPHHSSGMKPSRFCDIRAEGWPL